MQLFEKYCSKVCEQIRWKKAKPIIAHEIQNHLCDQRDAYVLDGYDENAATLKAISQMGDAVLVGQQLDKAHKPKPQWLMIMFTGALMLIGVAVDYFINSSANALSSFNVVPYILAFGVFIICYFFDFTILGKHPRKIYFILLIISMIGLMLSIQLNSTLYLNIGRFYMSLSYLSLVFPLTFALFVYSMRNKGTKGILLSGVAYLPYAVILLLVPSLSAVILYTASGLAVLCLAVCRNWFGVNKKQGFLLLTIFILCATAVFIVMAMPHMSVFINPYQDNLGRGYLYSFLRDYFSQAVFIGAGSYAQAAISGGMIPLLAADYSLAYLIQQLGYIVLACFILFIGAFAFASVNKALKEKSVLGSIIAISIILTFIMQSIFYIVSNLGYGIGSFMQLPFITGGNTALLINSALIGFMLSVFRTGEVAKDYLVLPLVSNDTSKA